MDADSIRAWLTALETLSYYELLGVNPHAGADQIRQGFYRFATSFHPDAHATRPVAERSSINTIFKRGTEAYRVLSDAAARMRYDEAMAKGGAAAARQTMTVPRQASASTSMRAPPPTLRQDDPSPAARDPVASLTGRLEDYVRQARARPFAQKAEELAKRKDYGKAKLQLKLAMNMDPNNPALESYLRDLDAQLATQKAKPV